MQMILTLEVPVTKRSEERSYYYFPQSVRVGTTYQRTFTREAPSKKERTFYLPHSSRRMIGFRKLTDIRTLEPVLFDYEMFNHADADDEPGSGISKACQEIDEIAAGLLAHGWEEIFDGFDVAAESEKPAASEPAADVQ